MPQNEYFDNFSGVIWVQPDGPNTAPYPLLCSDIDGLDEPRGDVTARMCRNPDGSLRTVNRSMGTPSEATGDIVQWESRTRNWLEKIARDRCPVGVYIHKGICGRADTFLSYERGKLLANAFVTTNSSAQNVRRRAEQGENSEMTEQTFSLSAEPEPELYFKLLQVTTNAQSEDNPLRDIITCTTPQCIGPCGDKQDACMYLQVAADSAASPSTANTYYSNDYAATWATGGTDPFAGGEDIASLVCIQIDEDTERIIAALGTTRAGGPMVINYSDDGGATWAGEVTVGATNGEYAMHSGALFALDNRHIWLCTSAANVFFSADAGLTWTDQGAPAPGASEGLWYVHFADKDYGMAVGGFRTTPTGLFIQTTDGGAHWSLMTTEPAVELGVWVSVIDNQRAWVGLDDGTVEYTDDWGTTWTARTLPVTPANTGDGRFINEYFGFIGGYRTISGNHYAVMYRTFDGGYDWEYYTHATSFSVTPTGAFGINAIQVCHPNKVHAVGEQLTGGNSLVWTLKPEGDTWS